MAGRFYDVCFSPRADIREGREKAAPIAEKKKPAAEALQAGRSRRGLLIYINAEYAGAFA